MQMGLKPDEVLDMSLEVFQACTRGYSDRLFDQQLIAVQQGYWAGYYNRSKKPKSLKQIFEKLVKGRNAKTSNVKPDIDVEAFLKTEAKFKNKYNNL